MSLRRCGSVEEVPPRALRCTHWTDATMAIDYEKEWPFLRVAWANDKIREWEERLNKEESRAERDRLASDIGMMRRALRDWEDALSAD